MKISKRAVIMLFTTLVVLCYLTYLTHTSCPTITNSLTIGWVDDTPDALPIPETEPSTWQEQVAAKWKNSKEAASAWTHETATEVQDWGKQTARDVGYWWEDSSPLEGEKTVITRYLTQAKRYCEAQNH